MTTTILKYDEKRRLTEIKDIPTTPHYAALIQGQINQGDGYGGNSIVNVIEYIAFSSKDKLQQWLIEEVINSTYKHAPYKIIFVNPVDINFTTTVEIKN